jgi:squalene-associated FAD-dependent desaturase
VAAVSRFDAIVVGGGCAGLSAAVRLAGGGAKVLVLEARSRLGGRATTFQDRVTGEPVDNGQHVLLGCYRETLAFLSAIGARDRVRAQPNLSVTMIDEAGTRTELTCPPWPAPWHLLAGACRWSALGWSDRLALLRMAAPIRAEAGAPSNETVQSWLAAHGQTERLLRFLWEPLVLAAMNQPMDAVSAAPFQRVLAEMFTGSSENSAVVLPARPLIEMYAEPAREYITRAGGDVRLSTPATVNVQGRRIVVTAGRETFESSATIVAVPWVKLDTTITGETAPLASTLAAAAATKPSPIVTVNLWYDAPIFDRPFVGLPGRTAQWLFDTAAIVPGMTHLSIVSSGATALLTETNDAIVAMADAELRASIHAARNARIVKSTVIRQPHATFSLAPGQPPRPATATALPRLWLAGDWIETGLPATIESAVRSGHAAADRALSSGTSS